MGRVRTLALGFFLIFTACILMIIDMSFLSYVASFYKFAIGITFNLIYIYTSEAFPTNIRTIGFGVANAFTRVGGIISPLLSQIVFAFHVYVPIYIFAGLSFIAFVLSLLLPFETLGREIE